MIFRLQGIKVLWRLQLLEYLRTLSLKFQKARTKIEVVLSLPCWLSQFSWDSQQGRLRTTSILVRAFWNFKCKVLKYSKTCSLHNTLIPNLVKPLTGTYMDKLLNIHCYLSPAPWAFWVYKCTQRYLEKVTRFKGCRAFCLLYTMGFLSLWGQIRCFIIHAVSLHFFSFPIIINVIY